MDAILSHRVLADGSTEFEVKWYATDLISWLPGTDLKAVTKAIDYCKLHRIPPPGTAPAKPNSKGKISTAVTRQRRGPPAS